MGHFANKLKDKLNNMSNEEFEKTFEKITHDKWRARWSEKFHNLSKDKRLSIIKRYKNKYESKEYINSEYKKGYESRTPVYDIFWEYARKYGEHLKTVNEAGYFPSEYILLDDDYVIRLMIGQGSVIDIFTKKELDDYIERIKKEIKLEN